MPYNFAADSFHTKKLCSRLATPMYQPYQNITLSIVGYQRKAYYRTS